MLCEATDEIDVVGEASNGSDAIRLVAESAPDVILMDLRMPGLYEIAATRQITSSHPAVKVLVLTTFDDDDHFYPALAAGAAGFLVKDGGGRVPSMSTIWTERRGRCAASCRRCAPSTPPWCRRRGRVRRGRGRRASRWSRADAGGTRA